jgi:L-malate glycosyltransferase
MLTVLLATKNRARILREVLQTFSALRAPAGGWKLVVVDNGSSDDTAEVVESFAGRLPVRYLLERREGKNAALNRGLAEIEGNLVVLTDDDVFPRSDWLIQLRQASDWHREFTMFGGAIAPRWEADPPSWVQWLDLGPIFGLTDPSLEEGELPASIIQTIQGANMAIRADLFASGVRFDSTIGPRGASYPMGSETELVLRLCRQGHRGWFVPHAVVEHFVRREQLDKDWILQRAIRWGRGRFRMAANDEKLWMGLPRYLFRDVPKECISLLLASIAFRPDAALRARWRLNILRGKAVEARNLVRERRSELARPHEPISLQAPQ